jgi:hypothetical protein
LEGKVLATNTWKLNTYMIFIGWNKRIC